ncbi:MAG TPA: hypothetical protein VFN22_04710 [Gemmatimonadales bacterium]|nr:hypothetical protein [Gemmatimonadales bacterium]
MAAPEADLSRVRTVPFAGRNNRVGPAQFATPPGEDRSFATFLDSLPDVLAVSQLRQTMSHLAAAARTRRGVILLLGGHVIKTGLVPLLIDAIRRGLVTHVAMNGAAAIHDFELARFGGTSEDVDAGLADGSFGMVEETGREMNEAIRLGAARGHGLGEALARAVPPPMSAGAAGPASLLAACLAQEIGLSVHPTIGADIIHQHAGFDGAAIGATAARDFRRLAGALPTLHEGGAVLNIGSAVVMPEVFLKALTIARNLDHGVPRDFLAADFDMIRHYRPRLNVVDRPTRAGGVGFQFTGHHEIMLPLLFWGVVATLDAEPAG